MWLEATLFYADSLEAIKAVVEKCDLDKVHNIQSARPRM